LNIYLNKKQQIAIIDAWHFIDELCKDPFCEDEKCFNSREELGKMKAKIEKAN
jgi:hypothetical protein